MMEAVQGATASFQNAFATRAGCECVAHALQGITELNPLATVTSIDGTSAYDLISRRVMMQGLHDVDHTAVPFVSMFYGTPSRYLWEDDAGTTHTIVQGEGGEQGDAMMPLLFALGQHPALEAVQRHLADGEFIFAYLDDIYFVTVPERTGIVYNLLQNALWHTAGIRIHQGKTKVWNNAGEQPAACEVLDRMARTADPSVTTSVWRGSDVPVSQQGMKVLGTPLGHPAFVRAHLERTSGEHQTLLDRIPMVSDLQSSWLLLVHCASARANYISRVVEPGAAEDFCRRHDAGLWKCFCACMQIDPDQPQDVMDTATLPLALGGFGLRSAIRRSAPAYWASWADCVSMIHKRHPTASAALVRALEGQPDTPFLKAASQCIWHGVPCRLRESLKTENQEPHTADGNTKLACELKVSSERNCSHALRPRSRH